MSMIFSNSMFEFYEKRNWDFSNIEKEFKNAFVFKYSLIEALREASKSGKFTSNEIKNILKEGDIVYNKMLEEQKGSKKQDKFNKKIKNSDYNFYANEIMAKRINYVDFFNQYKTVLSEEEFNNMKKEIDGMLEEKHKETEMKEKLSNSKIKQEELLGLEILKEYIENNKTLEELSKEKELDFDEVRKIIKGLMILHPEYKEIYESKTKQLNDKINEEDPIQLINKVYNYLINGIVDEKTGETKKFEMSDYKNLSEDISFDMLKELACLYMKKGKLDATIYKEIRKFNKKQNKEVKEIEEEKIK